MNISQAPVYNKQNDIVPWWEC